MKTEKETGDNIKMDLNVAELGQDRSHGGLWYWWCWPVGFCSFVQRVHGLGFNWKKPSITRQEGKGRGTGGSPLRQQFIS